MLKYITHRATTPWKQYTYVDKHEKNLPKLKIGLTFYSKNTKWALKTAGKIIKMLLVDYFVIHEGVKSKDVNLR